MGSLDRIEVNTIKTVHAKFGAFVQQITKSIDFGVKRPDMISSRHRKLFRTNFCDCKIPRRFPDLHRVKLLYQTILKIAGRQIIVTNWINSE